MKHLNLRAFIAATILSLLIEPALYAQNKKDSLTLEYSRPGRYHQLLSDLVGEWSFKGRHFSGNPNPDSNKVVIEFGGSSVRKSFAHGRYFFVELTGGKLPIPVKDGKMIEEMNQDIETEGYDNVKNKFVLTFFNNYVGSGIAFAEGSYDSTARTITYEWTNELVPGRKVKIKKHLIFQDNDHYTLVYYRERDGRMLKATEMNYTRIKGK